MTRTELQDLVEERVRDAKFLLAGKRWSSAYYLAGYAVECALKAIIAKRTQAEEFPDKILADKCWTHDLERLFLVADLKDQFAAARAADAELKENWELVKDWTEASRYRRIPKGEANDLFKAIIDRKHGVLPWIKCYW